MNPIILPPAMDKRKGRRGSSDLLWQLVKEGKSKLKLVNPA